MKLVILLSLSAALFSCGIFKKKDKEKEIVTTEVTETVNTLTPRKATLGDTGQASDPLEISNIVIEDNIMKIDISYSGGCQVHDYDLVGNYAVMKSMPPKRSVQLVHRAKGDNCRTVIKETLKFDISELAMDQKAGSEIILMVDGFKEEISYKFK